MQIIQTLAAGITAMRNCEARDNNAVAQEWRDYLEALVRNYAPSGSGFDAGTTLDFDASNDEKIVFTTSFHHMDDNGFYCGWSEHTVIFTPSFHGFNIRVTGRNVRDIKDYIADVFSGFADSGDVLTFGEWREAGKAAA